MKGSMFLRLASTLTASTTKLRSLYLSYILWTIGSSIRQGPHQVAQTFNSTTLPLSCERRTAPPSAPANSRAGNGGGGSAWLATGGGRDRAATAVTARTRLLNRRIHAP